MTNQWILGTCFNVFIDQRIIHIATPQTTYIAHADQVRHLREPVVRGRDEEHVGHVRIGGVCLGACLGLG